MTGVTPTVAKKHRVGGVEGLAISHTNASTNVINTSLESQIVVVQANLIEAQEIIKILSAFNERVFGNNVLGIQPMPENPINITGQLSHLHYLQYDLRQHLETIRSIVGALSEI